jgi:rare lipoprotein A
MIRRLVPVLVIALLAAGCASTRPGGYYEDDGPHERPRVDVSRVPDAVPRPEPINERNNRPYTVFGVGYRPLASADGYRERGVASWYGKKFHGRKTSNGEAYDMYAMTAAHKTLPLPSYARVRNLNNGKSVIVRVNDRGPFRDNRLVDLSYAAAYRLGILGTGTGIVEVEGLSGDVPVTTAAAPPAAKLNPIATAEAASPPRLYLQAGAFGSRDNAERLRDRLARARIVPVHVEPAQLAGQPLYRVRIGPLDSVEASDRVAEQVHGQGLPRPIVVVE